MSAMVTELSRPATGSGRRGLASVLVVPRNGSKQFVAVLTGATVAARRHGGQLG